MWLPVVSGDRVSIHSIRCLPCPCWDGRLRKWATSCQDISLPEACSRFPFGFLADRWPRHPQIILGSFAAPLLLLLIPFAHSFTEVMAIVFAIGTLSAFSRASILAIRTELGRSHGMATLAGLHGSAFASGQMIGPVVCGAVVDLLGLSAAFPFGSLIGVLGSVGVILWLRRAARTEPNLASG